MEPLPLNLTQIKISFAEKVRNTMRITTTNQKKMFLFKVYCVHYFRRARVFPANTCKNASPFVLPAISLSPIIYKQVHDDSLW